MPDQCSWCSTPVREDDGFRVGQPAAGRRATFCRLEHVVPWALQGPTWQRGAIVRAGEPDDALGRCALCGADLGDERILVVRHRGHHRIADAFCRVDHLHEWAKGGGRYRAAS